MMCQCNQSDGIRFTQLIPAVNNGLWIASVSCFLHHRSSSSIVHRPSSKLLYLPPFRFEYVIICVSFSNTKEKGVGKKEEALQYTTTNQRSQRLLLKPLFPYCSVKSLLCGHCKRFFPSSCICCAAILVDRSPSFGSSLAKNQRTKKDMFLITHKPSLATHNFFAVTVTFIKSIKQNDSR